MALPLKFAIFLLCWEHLAASGDTKKRSGRRATINRNQALSEQPHSTQRSRLGQLLGKKEETGQPLPPAEQFLVPFYLWGTSVSGYQRHSCYVTRESGLYKCEDVIAHCLKSLNLRPDLRDAEWQVYSYFSRRYLHVRADCSDMFEKCHNYPVEIGQFKAGITDQPIKITVMKSQRTGGPYQIRECTAIPHSFLFLECERVLRDCGSTDKIYKLLANGKLEELNSHNCTPMSYGGEFFIVAYNNVTVQVRMCPLDSRNTDLVPYTPTIFSTPASMYRELFPRSNVPIDKIKVFVREKQKYQTLFSKFMEWSPNEVYSLRDLDYQYDMVEQP